MLNRKFYFAGERLGDRDDQHHSTQEPSSTPDLEKKAADLLHRYSTPDSDTRDGGVVG